MLIGVLLIYPLILMLVHVIFLRLSRKPVLSRQKQLVRIILIMDGIMLVVSLVVMRFDAFFILYGFLVINAFAYAYFHFFNMSETARRIKLLVGIRKNRIKYLQDIRQVYRYDQSLIIRLERLEQLSQIRQKTPDQYVLKGRLLYRIANVVFLFRKMLGFESEALKKEIHLEMDKEKGNHDGSG
jgi:hypothetical protein